MRKKLFILMVAGALLLTACGSEEEALKESATKETVIAVKDQEATEQKNDQVAVGSNQDEQAQSVTDILESYVVRGETPQAIIDVLLNDGEFIDTEKDNKSTRMSEFTYADEEQLLKVTEYAIVDIDGDGYNEIVAYLDAYIGLVEVFHYEDGKVYGYQLGYTSVRQISADGVFEQGTTASELYHYRLEFDKETSTAVILCGIEGSDRYFIGDAQVSAEEFKVFEENIYREKAVLYTDLNLLTRFSDLEKNIHIK